ncbi:MAG: hypothetical protein WAK18_14805 [Nocardioidaceae bacterium]
MNVEKRLAEELERMASGLPAPETSLSGLTRAGRSERRRRSSLAVVGGAAITAAAVFATAWWGGLSHQTPQPADHGSRPPVSTTATSLDDLPLGDATVVPWWQDGKLHVDGTVIATPLRQIAFRGGTTVVGRSGSEDASWFLVRDGNLHPLVSSSTPPAPVVSADGAIMAWVEEEHSTKLSRLTSRVDYRIVAYDVGSERVTGTLARTETVQCCDAGGVLTVVGVDLDGRVLVNSLGVETFIWTPGGAVSPISAAIAPAVQPDTWPLGLMWHGQGTGSDNDAGHYGTVGPDGMVHPVGVVPNGATGLWSTDGSRYVYPGTADGAAPPKEPLEHLWVVDTGSQRRTALELPAEAQFSPVAWESANVVLLQARQQQAGALHVPDGRLMSLVRCRADTGGCERVATGPTGNAVLP